MPIYPNWTLRMIQEANHKAGFRFFDGERLHAFRAVNYPDSVRQGPGGVYFVSCAGTTDEDGDRIFGVFSFNPTTGDVRAVRGYGAFPSKRAACRAATRIAQLAP